MVALTQPGPGGLVEVTGHASAARPDGANGGTPNVIAHFANEKTATHLEFLTQALRESKREDAPTAFVAVLTPGQLAKARYTEGIIYAEDQDGAWERAFRVKSARRPLTLIVGPKGNVLWQQEGELDVATLAAALQRLLVKSGPIRLGLLRLNLRIGRPAPNFLFRELTLRKLVGRPVLLVFWKSASKPSLETVRDLQKATSKAAGQAPVVLAINVGEAREVTERVAAEDGLSAIVVPDPQREISAAYGVSIYPTAVFIDASGLVRNIRYGRFSGEQAEYSSRAKTAAAK
jgi:peroxiredoxin